MHSIRKQYGFTLVELVVVIAVLAILSTIAIVSYTVVLRQSHDSKRSSDMTALQTTLETYYQKNGVYPSGCIQKNYSSTVGCSVYSDVNSPSSLTGDGSMYSEQNPSEQINSSTTLSQLRSILPGIDESFGDPVNTEGSPITYADDGGLKYIYIGGLVNTTSSRTQYYVTYNNNNGTLDSTFACGMWFWLNPGQISSYVIGYYSEEDQLWHMFDGTHGSNILYGPGNNPDTKSADKRYPYCWNGAADAVFELRQP